MQIISNSYLKGAYKKSVDRLPIKAHCNRTRGYGFKLKEDRFTLDTRKKFFILRVVGQLPREVMLHPQKYSSLGWTAL